MIGAECKFYTQANEFLLLEASMNSARIMHYSCFNIRNEELFACLGLYVCAAVTQIVVRNAIFDKE